MRRLALAATALIAAGCGGGSHSSSSTTTATATRPTTTHLDTKPNLTSAFTPNGPIPSLYTCDGADKPLPLRWSTVPKGTRELVLVMRDPDAPIPDFVHWAVAGIPPSARQIPAGAIEGRNSSGTIGYHGPCPPRGARPHHYVLTLSALAAPSGLTKPGFSADALRAPALGIYTLVGTYQRR
jgi:Raf kinase inhibitor-like YbhB/YbcL family protein